MRNRLLGRSVLKRFSNLRYRLLALLLVPLVLLTGTVVLLASKWSSDYTYEQLFTKVNTDLRVAGESFRRIEHDGEQQMSALAGSAEMSELLSQQNNSALLQLLEKQRLRHGFDFLKLLSSDGGKVLNRKGWSQHTLRLSPLSDLMMAADRSLDAGVSGVEIYSASDWQRESRIVSEKVILPLVATARAAPTKRAVEDRAMIIRTLQGVKNASGELVAVLESGLLLNRNFEFVDEIRDLVYGPGSLAPGSRGTVTVFLEDVRITTNVPSRDESRALGTRVSVEVRDAVLTRGESWIDRAFVVNDWYISAYEPILDVGGKRVGMLYAGYLEAPFRAELFKAIAVLSTLVLAGSLLAVGAAVIGARAIFTPIETMTSVVRATAAGEYRRIGPMSTGNEIGELASQFDGMLDTLETHREKIEHDAAVLEDKVQNRTAELEKQNQRLHDSIDLLHQTRRQLATAEKLAALGELTAGVAHEINNPTAVILGNMDVLVADLGSSRNGVQTEIDLIIEQVYRIRSITDRLLQCSRYDMPNDPDRPHSSFRSDISPVPSDSDHSPVEPVHLEVVIEETLRMLLHEFEGQQILVSQSHETQQFALIDRQELQQVLVNLVTNAVEAIKQKAKLNNENLSSGDKRQNAQIDIRTFDADSDTVILSVSDNGCGIEVDHLLRVFDPFFTFGKVQGTGLGLSVSYGIVRRSGGDIRVQSQLGEGSVFEVQLPGVASVGVGA
ncbi:MAG: two-component system NtrC family sensor kinase [Granulosicoccus sp.]